MPATCRYIFDHLGEVGYILVAHQTGGFLDAAAPQQILGFLQPDTNPKVLNGKSSSLNSIVELCDDLMEAHTNAGFPILAK